MPLPLRHRSTLDLLNDVHNNNSNDGFESRYATSSAVPHRRPTGLRPATAQPNLNDNLDPIQRTYSPPVQEQNPATHRFSMLRWRHYSDTSLAATARAQAAQEERPPVPDMPVIPSQTTGITALHLTVKPWYSIADSVFSNSSSHHHHRSDRGHVRAAQHS